MLSRILIGKSMRKILIFNYYRYWFLTSNGSVADSIFFDKEDVKHFLKIFEKFDKARKTTKESMFEKDLFKQLTIIKTTFADYFILI